MQTQHRSLLYNSTDHLHMSTDASDCPRNLISLMLSPGGWCVMFLNICILWKWCAESFKSIIKLIKVSCAASLWLICSEKFRTIFVRQTDVLLRFGNAIVLCPVIFIKVQSFEKTLSKRHVWRSVRDMRENFLTSLRVQWVLAPRLEPKSSAWQAV